jgi:hypothetical protein
MKQLLAAVLSIGLAACVEAHETRAGDAGPRVQRAERAMQQLRTQLSRSSEGLTVERRPDGITKVSLQRRFRSASVMTPEGRAMCVDSPAALDRLIGARP